jgi:RNA polymerase sigma-70 factor (ECF subfamily)
MEQRVVAAAADHLDENDVDAQLVARIRRLDGDAFHQLYDRHYGRLARFLGGLTSDFAEAEEIINDTLWFVWTQARELPQQSRVSAWITRLAYRHGLRVLSRVPSSDRSSRKAVAATDSNGEAAMRAEVERQLLQRALTELPLKDRLLLSLVYNLGASSEEIAEIVEWPVSAVKVRMYAARRRLNRSLARHERHHAAGTLDSVASHGTINNSKAGINPHS